MRDKDRLLFVVRKLSNPAEWADSYTTAPLTQLGGASSWLL